MKILIKDVDVIPVNGRDTFLRGVNICTHNKKIVAIGDIPEGFYPTRVFEGKHRIALPGLINAYTASSFSLFRNKKEEVSYSTWEQDFFWPEVQEMSAKYLEVGAMLGVAELIASGVTTCIDTHFNILESVQAIGEAGMRGVLVNLLEESWDKNRLEAENFVKLYKEFHGSYDGRLAVMAGPYSHEVCSLNYLKRLNSFFREIPTGLFMHMALTKKSNEQCMATYGITPLELYRTAGLLDRHCLLVGATNLSHHDKGICSRYNVSIVHTPSMEAKYGFGFAPLSDMIAAGLNVALGTGAPPNNNNQSLFKEMHMTALVQKGLTGDASAIKAEEVIAMATLNGAKALGMEDKIGSLEVGKEADIILIDTDKPHLTPMNDPLSAVVYSAQATDVDTVIVAGNILMTKRYIKTMRADSIMQQAHKHTEKQGH